MTDQNFAFININERAYKYIRQFTIKSIDDSIIELITNAIDAYNKTEYVERYIYIDVFEETTIRVTDHALGLTASSLESCFLQLGNYTASDSSRGFFSRGAKDISALGDVIFETIKNNPLNPNGDFPLLGHSIEDLQHLIELKQLGIKATEQFRLFRKNHKNANYDVDQLCIEEGGQNCDLFTLKPHQSWTTELYTKLISYLYSSQAGGTNILKTRKKTKHEY